MGSFITYQCKHCRYEENEIGVGRGRNPFPYLALCCCSRCKTVGSTWIQDNQPARCGVCYDAGVTLLPDDTTRIDCPRCGRPANVTPAAGSWE